MTPERFEEIVDARFAKCREVLVNKGAEYSRDGDRTHNFKKAGMKRNCTPLQALMGMKTKHDVSLDDIVEDAANGILPLNATLDEKITDLINYVILAEGLLVEQMESGQEEESEPASEAQLADNIDEDYFDASHRIVDPKPTGKPRPRSARPIVQRRR